jgi:hypothetical protein
MPGMSFVSGISSHFVSEPAFRTALVLGVAPGETANTAMPVGSGEPAQRPNRRRLPRSFLAVAIVKMWAAHRLDGAGELLWAPRRSTGPRFNTFQP